MCHERGTTGDSQFKGTEGTKGQIEFATEGTEGTKGQIEFATEGTEGTKGQIEVIKKSQLPWVGSCDFIIGGGGGNRTRVRKRFDNGIYVCSLFI